MTKDPLNLPIRRINSSAVTRPDAQTPHRISLSGEQVSSLIETGGKVAEGAMSIAKDLVEISRIKAESGAEVAGIEARTHAMVAALRAETERLMAVRKGIRTRGEVAVDVIKSILTNIPESDHVTRQLAISSLNQLVATIISENNTSLPSKT